MYDYGLIGAGNMGGAMLRGAVKKFGADHFLVSTASHKSRERLKKELGVAVTGENARVAAESRYCILAVKPYLFPAIMPEISSALWENSIVISVAAGITISQMKEAFGSSRRMIRAMPNTPAAVGEAMTGLCFDDSGYSQEEREEILDFFCSFGRAEVITEAQMNAVICVSGSSPAYAYLLIESLADSGVYAGLPRGQAQKMAAQAVLGAAKMVLETSKHPGELKDAVCSPHGTTIAGVTALEEAGFRGAVLRAGKACYQRAQEMDER